MKLARVETGFLRKAIASCRPASKVISGVKERKEEERRNETYVSPRADSGPEGAGGRTSTTFVLFLTFLILERR